MEDNFPFEEPPVHVHWWKEGKRNGCGLFLGGPTKLRASVSSVALVFPTETGSPARQTQEVLLLHGFG